MADHSIPEQFLSTLASVLENAGEPAGAFSFKWDPAAVPPLVVGDVDLGAPPSGTYEIADILQMPVIAGQNVNTNTTLTYESPTREDNGWSESAGVFTYSGLPDRVEVEINVEISGTSTRATIGATLVGGGVIFPQSRDNYIRNTGGQNEQSIVAALTDAVPGASPSYQVDTAQLAGSGTVLTGIGFVTVRAVRRITF